MRKVFKNTALVLTLILIFTGLAVSQASSAEPVTLKFHLDDVSASTHFISMQEFEKEVEEKSGGSIQVELYGDRVLGSAAETIEAMMYGSLEMVLCSTAPMSNFLQELACIDAPFIFRDAAHAEAVMDGEIGKWLQDLMLERTGVRILGFQVTGFRHVFSNKPVRSLEDFKGLKIRTMPSDIHVATFEALGAIPTPMAAGEIFSGLQQNTVDAAENAYSFIINARMYEVSKYVTESGHFYGFMGVNIAEAFYQSLTDEQRQIIDTAAANCIAFQRELMAKQNIDCKEQLRQMDGIELMDIDRQALQDAVQSVYEEYKDILNPEIITKIKAY